MTDNSETNYRRGEFAREKGEIILREHEYDGIQEFDQKLPNWWLFTFYGAIVFFIGMWFLNYTIKILPTDEERIQNAVMKVFDNRSAMLAKTVSSLTDHDLVKVWATNPSIVKSGETIYLQVCIACHGPNLDAPNKLALSLVDRNWKYGGKPMEIFKLINHGTPLESKGMEPSGARMLAYGQQFTPDQVASLTAFIISKNSEEFKDF